MEVGKLQNESYFDNCSNRIAANSLAKLYGIRKYKMNKTFALGLIGVFAWAIGMLGIVFGVVTSGGWERTSFAGSPLAPDDTQAQQLTSCDDIPSLTNRIICRTVTWGNPVWLGQKFISGFAPDVGEAFRAMTQAINTFFQILFAGLAGFIALSTFQANAPQILIMPIMIFINLTMSYTIIKIFRGGG